MEATHKTYSFDDSLSRKESRRLLEDGHKEILQSECYQEYGYPSYIDR